MHVADVRGSLLLRRVDDRPHRLSAGRGDRRARRGRSVIYDCLVNTRMWANAQPDGRPAEHRWRPLFNAAKFA